MADLAQLIEELIKLSQREKTNNIPYIQVRNYSDTTTR